MSHDICEEMPDLPRGRLVQIVVLLTLSFAVLAAPGVDDIETFGGAAEDDPAVGDLVLISLQLKANITMKPDRFKVHSHGQ